PVDLLDGDRDVEEACRVVSPAADEVQVLLLERARHLEDAPHPVVAVGDTVLLLPEAGDEEVGPVAEQPRLAVAQEEAAPLEAPAHERGERPVHTEEVPARHLEARAQLVALAVPEAVREGHRRRLVRAHHEVARGAALGVEGDEVPLYYLRAGSGSCGGRPSPRYPRR